MWQKRAVRLVAFTGAVLALRIALQAQEAQPPAPPPESPLAVKPTTIPGNFDAALLMVKLARLDLAKYYLEQLLALNPSDEDLLDLRKQHGTATFLELAGVKDLNPPATTLLDRVNDAVRKLGEQPEYVENLVRKLGGSPREHAEALLELRHLGPYAVPVILKNLNGQLGVERDVLAVTLAKLGADAVPPLVGALASPDENVRSLAAEIIGRIGGPADMIWLWLPAFGEGQEPGTQRTAREALARLKYHDVRAVGRLSADGAINLLLLTATQHLSGKYKWPEVYDDQPAIPVWTWDAQSGTVKEHPVERRQASTFFAERLAREAAALAPSSEHAPVVLLAALLVRDMDQGAWQKPFPIGPGTAHDLTIRCGPETCERVLRYALDHKLAGAAIGALEALALNGSIDLLRGEPAHAAIIDALDSPEPRVQFAAATAILTWEPVHGFRGARRVVEILARAINAQSAQASVVMDPNVQRANATGSLFSELGFHPSLAATGMEGFQIAAERGDVTLAVLHPNVIRWELSQTLANLRADARTASIPIIIYGPPEIQARYERVAGDYQNVVYVNQAVNALDVNKNLKPLLAQLSPPPLMPQQRSEQAVEAAFWLRRIAIRNVPHVFELAPAEQALFEASHNPLVAEDALIALGAIGRPSVQSEFVETACAPAVDPKLRLLAAQQLATHVQRFGSLLKKTEVETLKTAWMNETDPQIQTALTSVIGALKPTTAAARKEILAQPMSAAPLGAGASPPPAPGL